VGEEKVQDEWTQVLAMEESSKDASPLEENEQIKSLNFPLG
jgi:hypothetical protein